MSLLDQDIPASHNCAGCNILLGHLQDTARKAQSVGRNIAQEDDGIRKVTIHIKPSKRPYVAPFRRVQTLQRLTQYVGSLPHPNIRLVTASNHAIPKFKVLEDLLHAGNWQLLDKSGCIIRPEDWEELVHAGMVFTLDTAPYEDQAAGENPPLSIQPLNINTNAANEDKTPWNNRDDAAVDLLDFQNSSEPLVQRADVLGYDGRTFIPYQTPKSDLAGNMKVTEVLESGFSMPPKPGSWVQNWNEKTLGMSPGAVEFTPSAAIPPPKLFRGPENTRLTKANGRSAEPIFQVRQATAKRSMAIPIKRPPSPPLTAVEPSKLDMPDAYHQYPTIENEQEEEIAETEAKKFDIGSTRETENIEAHKPEEDKLFPVQAPDTEYSESSTDPEGSGWGDDDDYDPLEVKVDLKNGAGELKRKVSGEDISRERRGQDERSLLGDISPPDVKESSSDFLQIKDHRVPTPASRTHSPRPENKHDDENHLFDDDEEDDIQNTYQSTQEQRYDVATQEVGNLLAISHEPIKTTTLNPSAPLEVNEKKILRADSKFKVDAAEFTSTAKVENGGGIDMEPENRMKEAEEIRKLSPIAETRASNENGKGPFKFKVAIPDFKPSQWTPGPKWDEEPEQEPPSIGNIVKQLMPINPSPPKKEENLNKAVDKPTWDSPVQAAASGWDDPPQATAGTDDPTLDAAPSWQTEIASEHLKWSAWDDVANQNYEDQWNAKGLVAPPQDNDSEWAIQRKSEGMEASKHSPTAWKKSEGSSKAPWSTIVASSSKPALASKKIEIKNPNTGAAIHIPSKAPKVPHDLWVHFLPSSKIQSTKSEKVSISFNTQVRKLAKRYAVSYNNNQPLLKVANDLLRNPIFEVTISKHPDREGDKLLLPGEKRLGDFGISGEIWVSIIYSGKSEPLD